MVNPMFDDKIGEIIHKLTMQVFRDHIAHVLGPSPFDFRGRHLMSHQDAEKTADEIIAKMETMPDKGLEFMESVYRPEAYDE